MTTCQKYQIPILIVSVINLLFIWALSQSDVMAPFLCIVAFFCAMNYCFAKLHDRSVGDDPHRFVTCFVAAKVVKLISTLVFVFAIATFFEDVFLVSFLTVCLLYLTTLLVDLAMFVRYVNSY